VPCLVSTNNTLTGNQDWTASAPIMQGVMGEGKDVNRGASAPGFFKIEKIYFKVLK
jgi:hypothetical protein